LHADFAVLGVPLTKAPGGSPENATAARLARKLQEYAHDLTDGFYYIDGDRVVLKGKRWVDVAM